MTEAFSTPPAFTQITPESSDSPWSYKGRFGRLSYLAWTMILGFIVLGTVIALVIGGVMLHANFAHGIGGFVAIGLLLLIPFLYFMIVFQIRRLHDLNRTGWWVTLPLADSIINQVLTMLFHNVNISLAITGIAFIINVAFTLYLMIAKGTDGANDYGDQRSMPDWEKILGWINVVLMIVGVVALTLFAIPAYHHYQQEVAVTHQRTAYTTDNQSLGDNTTEAVTTPSPAP